MTVSLDAGVFYTHHDTDAARRDVGATALNSSHRRRMDGY